MRRNVLDTVLNAFPIWILLGSILSMFRPDLFVWFKPYIGYGLMVIMLGMGLTLKFEDFQRVLANPLYVGVAAILQFTVMPLLGWGLGYVFGLNQALAVGMIIVAACPGGTASNVICYLARVDTALSVAMTAVSTILAVVMTPLLTTLLIGDRVEVDPLNLFLGTARVVLAPVLLGIILNRFFPAVCGKVARISPVFALAAILMIIGSIIGEDRQLLLDSGLRLLAAVTTLHCLGFALGYLFARVLVGNEQVSRTVSIEVGMQNSGLGAVLAKDNFPALIGVAAPCAITGSVHNIIGSVLVWVFRKWPASADDSASRVEADGPAEA